MVENWVLSMLISKVVVLYGRPGETGETPSPWETVLGLGAQGERLGVVEGGQGWSRWL